MTDDSAAARALATRLTHGGLHPRAQHGFVNPAVYHGSTVTFPDVDTMLTGGQRYVYGRRGNPTTSALEETLTDFEGAAGSVLTPSGLAAITTALLSCLSAGDHLLMIDTTYHPTRHFCDGMLKRLGISTTYFDPLAGAGIEALIRPETKAIYLEAPGSLTFEMPDIPAIVAVAKARDLVVLMDNTWATPLYFRPIDHGVDLSIMAGTKYVVGHSDVMIGTVAASVRAWKGLKAAHGDLGLCVGPDDVYLALRGLRTLDVRLERHRKSALEVAKWLQSRPEVARVLYPALPSDPGHAVWKRDFSGASGLLSFVTRKAPLSAVKAMLDRLALFGLGYSWGGYESLAIVSDPRSTRTATTWESEGHLVRLHIGLEDVGDLIADLDAGFARFAAAAG